MNEDGINYEVSIIINYLIDEIISKEAVHILEPANVASAERCTSHCSSERENLSINFIFKTLNENPTH